MTQFHLDTCDKGTVDPFFGCDTTGLTDDGAEIAFCQAHLRGVESYLMFVDSILVDKQDKAVEDGLLARLRDLLLCGIATEKIVVVVHLGSYKTADELAVVVVLVDDVPESFQNLSGGGNVGLRGW